MRDSRLKNEQAEEIEKDLTELGTTREAQQHGRQRTFPLHTLVVLENIAAENRE